MIFIEDWPYSLPLAPTTAMSLQCFSNLTLQLNVLSTKGCLAFLRFYFIVIFEAFSIASKMKNATRDINQNFTNNNFNEKKFEKAFVKKFIRKQFAI